MSLLEVNEDEIDSLLKKLQKSLDLAIDESHTKILNTETLLNDIVNQTENALYYILGAEKEFYNEKIDSLKAAAAKKSVNIDDCLAYGKSVIYLNNTAFNETLVCAEFLISTAVKKLNTELYRVSFYF